MRSSAIGTMTALVTILATSQPASAVPDIVLESRCAAAGSYVESGTWTTSTSKSSAPGCACAAGSKATQTVNGYAEFIPTIATAGNYTVYVSWGTFTPGGASNKGANAENVTFTIYDINGAHPIVLNQRGHSGCSPHNENTWLAIGTGDFTTGTSGKLRITNTATGQCNNGPSKRYVNADAAKFVYNAPVPVVPKTFGTVKALYR
jgi:hypothetical protein